MKLNSKAECYVPFSEGEDQAIAKTTHMVVAAHQDDIELMAQHGILTCFDDRSLNFAAVVCADGAGSPRSGIYADYTNEEMMKLRAREQKKAAVVGDYSFLALLNYSSAAIKDPSERALIEDLKEIFRTVRPKVVYTHNPADKHDTHISVSLRTLKALQELAADGEYLPDQVLGCEVWRSLDWVNDDEKLALDVSGHPALRAALLGVFDSQIEGGKRYDLAALGRFDANATYYASHNVDVMNAASYAIDMTELAKGGDPYAFVKAYIDRFAADVEKRVRTLESK